MPGADHKTVHHASLTEGAVLVLADAGERGEVPLGPEDRHAVAGGDHDLGPALRDLVHAAGIHPALRCSGLTDLLFPIACALRAGGAQVQGAEPDGAKAEGRGRDRPGLGLEGAKGHVQEDQRIGHVDQHVQRLPDWRREVAKPEVMAGRGHQDDDHQGAGSQGLEGELGDAVDARVRGEQADDRVHVAEGVELERREGAVQEGHGRHGDAQVPAVVEQRQPPRVAARERPDAEDDVQQHERRRTEPADQQRLQGGLGEYRG